MTIYILRPWDTPIGYPVNVTSGSADFGKALSPFTLGPCELYSPFISMNMENAWQYSKVHPEHVGGDIEPGDAYWSWAIAGWHNQRAVRYPMGKGAKPLYSWWNGQKLDYVAARRKIYIPLYARAVHEYAYPQFKRLQSIAVYSDLTIHDYDAYNHYKLNMSWSDVVNCTERKMGHGFVLALMLYELLNENYEFSF